MCHNYSSNELSDYSYGIAYSLVYRFNMFNRNTTYSVSSIFDYDAVAN